MINITVSIFKKIFYIEQFLKITTSLKETLLKLFN